MNDHKQWDAAFQWEKTLDENPTLRRQHEQVQSELARRDADIEQLERAVIDAAIRWSIYQEPLLSDEENLQRAVDALLAARGGK